MIDWQFKNNQYVIDFNFTDHLTLDNIPTEDNTMSSTWVARLDCPSLEDYYDTKTIQTPDSDLAKAYALEFAISSLKDHIAKAEAIIIDTFEKALEANKEPN